MEELLTGEITSNEEKAPVESWNILERKATKLDSNIRGTKVV
jgi:hypothetical protein